MEMFEKINTQKPELPDTSIPELLETLNIKNGSVHQLETALASDLTTLHKLHIDVAPALRSFIGTLILTIAASSHAEEQSVNTYQPEKFGHGEVQQEKDLHIDITQYVNAAESAGMTATVEVVAPDSTRMIIHIGQTHTYKELSAATPDVQKSTEATNTFLITAFDKMDTGIFYEGIDSETTAVSEETQTIAKKIDTANTLLSKDSQPLGIGLHILPAETTRTNRAPFDLIEETSDLGTLLYGRMAKLSHEESKNFDIILPRIGEVKPDFLKKFIDEINQTATYREDDLCQELLSNIRKNLLEIEKRTYDEREKVAVEQIASYAGIVATQEHFPLVYGSNHDFSRAVTEWNEAHPELQFNLVSVK